MGMVYRCDTLDLDLLAAWLGEWAPRLASPGIALRMLVFPLPKGPALHDGYDWPADSRFLGTPFIIPDEPGEILTAMQNERERIEREIAKLGPGRQPADG